MGTQGKNEKARPPSVACSARVLADRRSRRSPIGRTQPSAAMRAHGHIRSIPSINNSRIANIAIPMTIATTSIPPLLGAARHTRMTICAKGITIV
jgi:hypothetical protein